MPPDFDALHGRWSGSARSWFRPGELGDESSFEAEVRAAAAIIEYRSSIEGAPLAGVLLIAPGPEGSGPAIAWVDSFHRPSLMPLDPVITEGMLASAQGSYAAPDGPPWGWRIDIALEDDGRTLAIRHHNIPPAAPPPSASNGSPPARPSPLPTIDTDSAIECFTFALTALGDAVLPESFRDVTTRGALRAISPNDVLDGRIDVYDRTFPSVAALCRRESDLIRLVVDNTRCVKAPGGHLRRRPNRARRDCSARVLRGTRSD